MITAVRENAAGFFQCNFHICEGTLIRFDHCATSPGACTKPTGLTTTGPIAWFKKKAARKRLSCFKGRRFTFSWRRLHHSPHLSRHLQLGARFLLLCRVCLRLPIPYLRSAFLHLL